MDWRWPLLLSFLTTLFVLGWLDRKNIKIKQGALFRRTKRGRKAIKKFGSKHRKLLTLFGNVSVILALLLSVAGLYLILDRTFFMFSHPEIGPSVKFVLPEYGGVGYDILQHGCASGDDAGYFNIDKAYPGYPGSCGKPMCGKSPMSYWN